jgi:hypothetical protein
MNLMKSAKKLQQLAMKNKDKIADGVNKATDVIDKKTGGKHSDKLKKVDAAAAKLVGKQGEAGDTAADAADDAAPAQPATPASEHPTPEPN